MRIISFLFLLMPSVALAAPEVPIITFAQKVPIVVEAKHNPAILDVRIEQDKEEVSIDAIVDKNVDRDLAKTIGENLIMLTKTMTLDDHPVDDKEPGKGLYNYTVTVTRVDQVVLANGEKPAKEKAIKFDPPMMENLPPKFQPLTRADVIGR